MSKTKIAIIAPDVKSENDIWSYTSMMAYNIISRLEKSKDIEIVKRVITQTPESKDPSSVDWNGATHIFGVVLRYWTWHSQNTINSVKKNIPGKLFEFYDTGLHTSPTDINFAVMDFNLRPHKDIHIGWAADDQLFHINKSAKDETLNILIDHPLFSSKNKSLDRSDDIANQCFKLMTNSKLLNDINLKYGTAFKNVKCRRLISNGVEDLDINIKVNNDYNHASVGQKSLAYEYARAHIFIPTHQESIGMGILESAMSGCAVLAPHKLIKPSVLKHVNHAVFYDNIDWIDAIKYIDPIPNRKRVECWTWENCVNKIIKGLCDHDPFILKK